MTLRPMLVTLLANGDAGQACAVIEYVSPDTGDAVGNDDARQAAAAKECVIPDAGDAVGNGDARQASAARNASSPMLVTLSGMVMLVRLLQPSKCDNPDAGDGKPVLIVAANLKSRQWPIRVIIGNRHRP